MTDAGGKYGFSARKNKCLTQREIHGIVKQYVNEKKAELSTLTLAHRRLMV